MGKTGLPIRYMSLYLPKVITLRLKSLLLLDILTLMAKWGEKDSGYCRNWYLPTALALFQRSQSSNQLISRQPRLRNKSSLAQSLRLSVRRLWSSSSRASSPHSPYGTALGALFRPETGRCRRNRDERARTCLSSLRRRLAGPSPACTSFQCILSVLADGIRRGPPGTRRCSGYRQL